MSSSVHNRSSSLQCRIRAVRRRRRQAGYTALEFLVAFTVLSLFLTAGIAAVGVALRGDQQATFATLATALARTKLAAAGVDYPLRPGVATGVFTNGYLWRAEVRHFRSIATSESTQIRAFWVEVTVAAPAPNNRRSLSLASVAMAPMVRR
jgi:type II secretory pathway pseudopilin PulG